MSTMLIVDFLLRWLHVLVGVAWIGMLFYFNFVQAEYFKEAEQHALADAKKKLAPRALWWFRWGAMATLLTGVLLYGGVAGKKMANEFIVVGMVMGGIMFLNVWLVIWPKQKIMLGLAAGDVAASAPKAALASRTNTLFSAPMLFFMLASSHLTPLLPNAHLSVKDGHFGMWVAIAIVVLLELNALFGKAGPLASIRGVIHMSLFLVPVLFCAILFI